MIDSTPLPAHCSLGSFFLLQAIPLLKASIKKAYGKKGDKIVNMNYAAVDKALEKLVKIDIPQGWGKDEVSQRGATVLRLLQAPMP